LILPILSSEILWDIQSCENKVEGMLVIYVGSSQAQAGSVANPKGDETAKH
jgi:hypothetical protein